MFYSFFKKKITDIPSLYVQRPQKFEHFRRLKYTVFLLNRQTSRKTFEKKLFIFFRLLYILSKLKIATYRYIPIYIYIHNNTKTYYVLNFLFVYFNSNK